MHKLANLTRLAELALFIQHEYLGVWNRFTHRSGSSVQLLWREIGRSECFGEPIHEDYLCSRQRLPENLENGLWHCTTSIGDVAQIRERLFTQCRIWLRKQGPKCWHPSETRNAFLQEHLNNFPCKYEID